MTWYLSTILNFGNIDESNVFKSKPFRHEISIPYPLYKRIPDTLWEEHNTYVLKVGFPKLINSNEEMWKTNPGNDDPWMLKPFSNWECNNYSRKKM